MTTATKKLVGIGICTVAAAGAGYLALKVLAKQDDLIDEDGCFKRKPDAMEAIGIGALTLTAMVGSTVSTMIMLPTSVTDAMSKELVAKEDTKNE